MFNYGVPTTCLTLVNLYKINGYVWLPPQGSCHWKWPYKLDQHPKRGVLILQICVIKCKSACFFFFMRIFNWLHMSAHIFCLPYLKKFYLNFWVVCDNQPKNTQRTCPDPGELLVSWSSLGEVQQNDIPGLSQSVLVMVKKLILWLLHTCCKEPWVTMGPFCQDGFMVLR